MDMKETLQYVYQLKKGWSFPNRGYTSIKQLSTKELNEVEAYLWDNAWDLYNVDLKLRAARLIDNAGDIGFMDNEKKQSFKDEFKALGQEACDAYSGRWMNSTPLMKAIKKELKKRSKLEGAHLL